MVLLGDEVLYGCYYVEVEDVVLEVDFELGVEVFG